MNDDQKEQIVRFIAARTHQTRPDIVGMFDEGYTFTVDRDHPAGYWEPSPKTAAPFFAEERKAREQ